MSKHRVKTFTWNNTGLITYENFFDDVNDAVNFASHLEHHVVKVYGPEGLISSRTAIVVPKELNLYA